MRLPVTLAAVTVLAAGVVVAAALGLGGSPAEPRRSAAATPTTAEIVRTTLVRTERIAGDLGFGPAVDVPATAENGTLTWLPELGTTVRRGEAIYRVAEEPVVLLYGGLPFYRGLGPGDQGEDVAQLEANLVKLGYTGFTPDRAYTWATAAAVRAWQRDLGLSPTGLIAPEQLVVAPGAVRVAAHHANVGERLSGPALAYTDTSRVVTVDLEVRRQHLVEAGAPVQVALPDGVVAEGEVGDVGAAAVRAEEGASATVPVTITVSDEEDLGDWDTAPVEVVVEVERREEVLAVPVGALIAVPEGGYEVLVVAGAETRHEPVTTGMFASGLVEVTGDGIAGGDRVVVPS